MPGFDRTGPMGDGPMTGRARGYCRTGGADGTFGPGRRGGGGGFGRRFNASGANSGRRAGRGRMASPVPYEETGTENSEITDLKQQVQQIGDTLADLMEQVATITKRQ